MSIDANRLRRDDLELSEWSELVQIWCGRRLEHKKPSRVFRVSFAFLPQLSLNYYQDNWLAETPAQGQGGELLGAFFPSMAQAAIRLKRGKRQLLQLKKLIMFNNKVDDNSHERPKDQPGSGAYQLSLPLFEQIFLLLDQHIFRLFTSADN